MSLPISKVMKSTVLTAERSEAVSAALGRMQKAEVRHFPVIDGTRRLIGVVSERDLGRAAAMMQTAEGTRDTLRVGDVMNKEPLRVTRSLPAHEAAAMMIEHKIGMLPVVDEHGIVCGIVTAIDFLEFAREALLGVEPARRAGA
jgi:CBS domain-containing membrane protein